MNELITTNNLNGPSISGTVTVPLAELDRMRSDHLQALNLAKDLEMKQALIKIIIQQKERYTETVTDRFNKYGFENSRIIWKERLNDIETLYVNFDEIREPITLIEREKVQKELEELRDQINNFVKAREVQEKLISELRLTIDDKTKTCKELSKDKDELDTKYNKVIKESEELSIKLKEVEDTNGNLNSHINKIEKELFSIKTKKSLWYFLYSIFTGNDK